MHFELQAQRDISTASTRLTLLCILTADTYITDELITYAADLEMVRRVTIEGLCKDISKQLGRTVRPTLLGDPDSYWTFEVVEGEAVDG